ncbi:MAG: hypothetical protein IKC22_02525 [Bacilli bacterium]|nr:hypothetical protein [Bacilli bacterium]
MTEKDFKKIINDQESKQSSKVRINELKEKLTSIISKYLHQDVEIKDAKLGSWNTFGIYANTEEIYISIDLQSNLINKQYEYNLFLNEVENAMYFQQASKVERINNGLKVSVDNQDYIIELKSDYLTPVTYLNSFSRIVEEKCKDYTLLKNTLFIVNHLIKEEEIKDINVLFLTNLFIKTLEKESVENKYYKYLGYLSKALDDFTNNKKFEILDLVESDKLMNLNINEAKLTEYRKLRKAIVKAITVEEEQVKFDSQLEVVVDVNPLFDDVNKTFKWHYSVIGKNNENYGGVYKNDETEYQTAILKGIFKGLKAVVDLNLTKKKIILKCDYEGILTSKMLTNDENKSRMKTINSLIENNNLKVSCK